jgi:hypothetical protein
VSPLRELLLDLVESLMVVGFGVFGVCYLWGEIDSLRDAGVAARLVGVAFYGFVVYCIAAAVVS